MKKLFQSFLAFLLILSITACTQNISSANISEGDGTLELNFTGKAALIGYDLTVKIEDSKSGKEIKKETKHITSEGNRFNFQFEDLKVGSNLLVTATLSKDNVAEYKGSADPFVVESGENNVEIQLRKLGTINFISDTSTATPEKPIIVTLNNGKDFQDFTITGFPAELGVEDGTYTITLKSAANTEETVTVEPSDLGNYPIEFGNTAECCLSSEPNKVYYVAENGTGIGTKASPFGTVTQAIDKIEYGSGFTFNKGQDSHSFVVNVSGNIKEKNEINIKKGYEITIQGTAESPATITAVNSSGSGEADHRVMWITEYLGNSMEEWQCPTTVNLKHITITGGNIKDNGAGIALYDGTLYLGDGVVITGNKVQDDPVSSYYGDGIYVNPNDKNSSRPAVTKIILDGNAVIGGDNSTNAITILKKTESAELGQYNYKAEQIELMSGFTGSANVEFPDGAVNSMITCPAIITGELGKIDQLKVLGVGVNINSNGAIQ